MPAEAPTTGLVPSVVERSVEVRAHADAVWRVMVDPELGPRWLGGFRFESDWAVGGPFALVGTLNGHLYRDSGTLLGVESGRLLRFAHWSKLWRIPDIPGNRAVMTLALITEGDHTRVDLRHELPAAEALAQHSNFFWRGALEQLRRLCEG